ncbi:Uncharacterised protein [Mycobacteroides abscessus subsp. abscessus]|nr:Uncharacterised protein [Mycobacteroides abscessus subsp. abscessus]
MSDDDLAAAVDLPHRRGGRPAEGEEDVVVELVGDPSPDVVGADGGVEGAGTGGGEGLT